MKVDAVLALEPELIRRYEREYVLHPWTAQKRYTPFIVAGGEGSWFWDETGRRYLDFCSQLTNVNAGHQHPKIVQAIKDQAQTLCYALPSVSNDKRALLAKMIADIAPGDLSKTFILTGGGIANETALKMARAVTGRQKVIGRFRSFHGGTYGSSAVSGDPRRAAVEPSVPGSIHVWDPFCYRCFFKMRYPECGVYCAEAIREVVEVQGPETVAAVIVEPVTGSNCRIVPPGGYMERLRRICDDYGMLLVFDEVMTGFGRTGKWFAAEHWGVTPDIMTVSKGINSGALPLGAVVSGRRVASFFEDRILYAGMTQYGNPVSCASAIAAIEAYREEKMVENSASLGLVLRDRLREMEAAHPCVGDARGLGLFSAIELVKDKATREPLVPWTVEAYEKKDDATSALIRRLREKGLFTYMRWNVLMICPPLCLKREELEWGLERIDEELAVLDGTVA
jgi:taurine--2-oxoglutarate transaminase